MMFCPNCGRSVSDGSKFCGFCGANLLDFDKNKTLPVRPNMPVKSNQVTDNEPKFVQPLKNKTHKRSIDLSGITKRIKKLKNIRIVVLLVLFGLFVMGIAYVTIRPVGWYKVETMITDGTAYDLESYGFSGYVIFEMGGTGFVAMGGVDSGFRWTFETVRWADAYGNFTLDGDTLRLTVFSWEDDSILWKVICTKQDGPIPQRGELDTNWKWNLLF